MANRVVRAGILESDSVNKLTWAGEVFYRRLMSILDDYGRCDGRATILRSKLYPLRIDKVSEPDIVKWISECEKAGLVRKYQVDGKDYLEMFNFGQTVRIKRARVPPPRGDDITCKQMQADASTCSIETETETETETTAFSVNGSRFKGDFYTSGQQAFLEVQNDELLIERLQRVVEGEGIRFCDPVMVMKGVRRFITAEEAKPDFRTRTRDDVKEHLVNWIRAKAQTL